MFRSIATQSIAAIAAAALVAGLVVFLTSVAPEAKAESKVTDAVHQSLAKGDRLTILVKGAACSPRGWPHYEPNCQFDTRRPANETRTVRIIALR
jgi:hypothetical protein